MELTTVLFVCLGNICRSPMAEGIFGKIVERENALQHFEIDSAGLLSYHEGELPDSRMRFHASKRAYHLVHRSRPVKMSDFDRFDMIVGMDDDNIAGLKKMASTKEHEQKIYRMTDFCRIHQATSVPDPYYGGDNGFENVIDLLEDACEGLFMALKAKK